MSQLTTTAPATSTHPLVARITRLRSRTRTVLLLLGSSILLAAAVASIFLLMLSDYLLHLPAWSRVLLLLAWLSALAWLAWKYLITPLSTRLTDQFLASRIELVNKNMADELMSAVHFIHTRAYATNALAARHIDTTAAKTANLPFEQAVDFRSAFKAAGIAALVLAVAATVAALNPKLSTIALSRWFSANPQPWPKVTVVNFDWFAHGGRAPKVLPLNEKFIVRAKVTAGPLPRVWLYYKTDKDSREHSELMQIQKEQSTSKEFIFESSLQPDGKYLNLRIEAGDEDELPPVTISLAPRPQIIGLTANITPPPYVKNPKDPTKPAPAVVVDLLTQAARSVEGATVSLQIQSTKPFLTSAKGEPEVALFDATKDEQLALAMNRRLLDPTRAEINFRTSKTIQARAQLKDTDSFDNRVGGGVTLEVVPDALPSITITDPRRTVERAPNGFVDIALQATDDLGLDGLKLRAEKFDAAPNDPALFETDIKWADLTADPAVGTTTGKAKYSWDITPLNLAPGARVNFYVMVQDNYDVDGKRHPWVKSAPLQLIIRSSAEITESSRRNLNEIKERIRNLKGQQEQTQAMQTAIRKAVEASGVSTSQQKSTLSDLTQQQAQESATAAAIESRAEQVAEDLRQNKMGEGDLGKLAQEVADGMQGVAKDNMPRAAGDLNRASEAAGNRNSQDPKADAKRAAEALTGANTQQQTAVNTMDNLINRLGSASDFEALRTEVNKILDTQNKLAGDTAKIAPQTIGRDPKDLPKDTRDKLNDIAKNQKDLANRTAAAIEQMNKVAPQLAQTDPASSESIKKAADAGTEANVANSQSTASSNVNSNKMSEAAGNQANASRGLQNMLNELNKNDRRQLEQLARQLRALLEEVKKLRENEATLNKDTLAAGAKALEAPMQKLGDRQGTLQQNAIVLEKKAENTPRAKEAAPDLHEAGEHMAVAAAALYSSKQPEALSPEEKALAALDRAIEKIQKATDKTEAEAKDKDLAEYIKEYEAIRKDQQAVKDTSDTIEKNRLAAADKQLTRADSQKAGLLSTTQGGLMDRINALSADEKLKAFEVVIWMNGQVTEQMSTSKERLNKAQLGQLTALAQQGALDRLDMIITALKDEKRRAAEFQSQGQGGGQSGKPPLIPPLAELLMLKSMQVVVNAQTTSVHSASSAAASDAEKNDLLIEATKLGKKQGEIKTVADKVAQKLSR